MSFSRLGLCGVTLALLALAPAAYGQSLTAIQPVSPATATEPKGLTIAPSGQAIVVGTETPAASGIYGGFVWDATNGTRQVVSSDGAPCSAALGVGYRTSAGQPQLVINGSSSGWNTDWFSNDDGLTWVKKRRDTYWPNSNKGPLFVGQNSLGISPAGTAYYTICRKSITEIYSLKCDDSGGDPPAQLVSRDMKSTTTETSVRAASSSGLSVGSRKDSNGVEQNYMFQHRGVGVLPDNGTQSVAFLNGLAGNTFGQAWAVSQDGQVDGDGIVQKVFGMSPVSDGRTGNWPYVMWVKVTPQVADPTAYDITQNAIQEMPTYPDTTGSVTNAVPYGASADGNWAVGMNYRGQELAVLWDVRDPTPANWKVYDLTAYFGASDLLGDFTRLSRAFAVAVDANNVVVTGRGYTTAGATLAFVATIPLTAFPLPDVGACCMIGSCASKFQANCPDIAGQQRWTANTTCLNAACPGACCTDSMTGACSDFVESATCTGEGGTFLGSSTACTAGSCLASCCNTDGSCGAEAPGACTADGGIAGALGSVCEASTCIGACCVSAGNCVEMAYGICPPAKFQGVGTICEENTCPCSIPFADADGDGDVDQADFAVFQACYTGPGGILATGCECYDADPAGAPDNDIDSDDWTAFEACASGTGIAADPACDDVP